MRPIEIAEVLNHPVSQELLARRLGRLAYVAKDGTPRVVPIGFVWNEPHIVMCTTPKAAKIVALRHNPAIALTIDAEEHPPRLLLIRVRVELDQVTGVPPEYLQASRMDRMTPRQRDEFEPNVRSLYPEMVRIVVSPAWAKVIDFETTLPSAVEELIHRRERKQSTSAQSGGGA